MKKKSEIGRRIAKLRGDESRAAFARRLGVPRTALIAWESGTYKPQLDDCLKMTYLMDNLAEKLDFLETAGADVLALMHFAQALQKEAFAAPAGYAAVLLPLLGEGDPLPLPLAIAASAESSRYLRVGEPLAVLDAARGDVLLVDVSVTDTPGIARLWGQRLLVEFENEPSECVPRRTYEIGRLLLRRGYEGELGVTFEAQFYRWTDDLHETHAPREIGVDRQSTSKPIKRLAAESRLAYPEPEVLGTWSAKPSLLANQRPETLERLFQRARRELKLHPGIRVIGRVAGWMRPHEPRGGQI